MYSAKGGSSSIGEHLLPFVGKGFSDDAYSPECAGMLRLAAGETDSGWHREFLAANKRRCLVGNFTFLNADMLKRVLEVFFFLELSPFSFL